MKLGKYRGVAAAGMAGVVALALALSGCSGAGNSGAGGSGGSGGFADNDKVNVALSMAFSGNEWQDEARKLVEAIAGSEEYKDRVNLRVDIAGADVTAHARQINNEVADGADIIILVPVSPTGTNAAIKNACDQGVLVFTYNTLVTEPCAYNVKHSDYMFGYVGALWLANALDGVGNVVTITGIAGTEADTNRIQGMEDAFEGFPDIKIVGSAEGEWQQQKARTAFAQLKAANPDIDGVWAELGCLGVAQQLKSEGEPLIPCSGEATQGHRELMLPESDGGESWNSLSSSGSVYTGEYAFILAMQAYDGEDVPKNTLVPLPYVTTENISMGTDPAQGANVMPPGDVPIGFVNGFWSPLVSQGLKAALEGIPDTVSEPVPCADVPGCEQSDSQDIFNTLRELPEGAEGLARTAAELKSN